MLLDGMMVQEDGYARTFTKSHSRMVAFLFDKINYGRNIFAAVDGPDKTTKDYTARSLCDQSSL